MEIPRRQTLGLDVIDACARVAVQADLCATLADFMQDIFPEAQYNSPVDWKDPTRPYNHMYARYVSVVGRDATNMMPTPYGIAGRFVAWYRRGAHAQGHAEALEAILTRNNGQRDIERAWAFLARLSSDIGLYQCEVLCGDPEAAADTFARFIKTGRRGSHFWLACDDTLKEALVAWKSPFGHS
ncbi:hypothetical protein psal_cds_154 [Pandoravirus salinus]|uniref:Uncharacterized protein n=1 Tax=Pandoravirus salinus TaxID=1349410 RepID=S4VTI6_9VIRU|nr:hypothetical protein psal_cds_154 [Pandoravirus salinus]AGO83628.1 hypothetical protein psal_cds_154 [Pandoravirus salinus]